MANVSRGHGQPVVGDVTASESLGGCPSVVGHGQLLSDVAPPGVEPARVWCRFVACDVSAFWRRKGAEIAENGDVAT